MNASEFTTRMDAVADAIMHDIIAEDIRLEQRRPKHAWTPNPEPPQRSRSGSWWPRTTS